MDVVALGELLIDFTTVDTNNDGYPTMATHPSDIFGVPELGKVLKIWYKQ